MVDEVAGTQAGAPKRPAEAPEAPDEPRHRLAPRTAWPWLPSGAGTLQVHAYCADCGLVRFTGGQRALDLGGLANLIARLELRLREQGRKVTEAQRRLIVKRLEAGLAVDTFGLSRKSQYLLVADAVGAYLRLDREVVLSYLCDC